MPVVRLDPATLRFCADLAKSAAEKMPKPRAHHDAAAAALLALAEEIRLIAEAA